MQSLSSFFHLKSFNILKMSTIFRYIQTISLIFHFDIIHFNFLLNDYYLLKKHDQNHQSHSNFLSYPILLSSYHSQLFQFYLPNFY